MKRAIVLFFTVSPVPIRRVRVSSLFGGKMGYVGMYYSTGVISNALSSIVKSKYYYLTSSFRQGALQTSSRHTGLCLHPVATQISLE